MRHSFRQLNKPKKSERYPRDEECASQTPLSQHAVAELDTQPVSYEVEAVESSKGGGHGFEVTSLRRDFHTRN
jgi:hypothetical protein